MLESGIIIKPYIHLLPQYKLSPFGNSSIHTNSAATQSNLFEKYIANRFSEHKRYFSISGRHALNEALSTLNLKGTDIVSIVTTTNNLYISGCVTREIEKFCHWDRQITTKTKAIIINHEFGFAYEDLEQLKSYGLPIIEDCAYSFNSNNESNNVGQVGDFTVFSFPKFFPIQFGGLLISKREIEIQRSVTDAEFNYLNNALSLYVDSIDLISAKRIDNFNYGVEKFTDLGISPRLNATARNIPGVFLFNLPENMDPTRLKVLFYKQGVECSVFYGENAFFLPCHQEISFDDFAYFYNIVKYFFNHS